MDPGFSDILEEDGCPVRLRRRFPDVQKDRIRFNFPRGCNCASRYLHFTGILDRNPMVITQDAKILNADVFMSDNPYSFTKLIIPKNSGAISIQGHVVRIDGNPPG